MSLHVSRPRPRPIPATLLRPHEQTCARCGAVDGMNFQVPDYIWHAVAFPEWTNNDFDSVLCLACFDQLAERKQVRYAEHLHNVLFVSWECFGLDVVDVQSEVRDTERETL